MNAAASVLRLRAADAEDLSVISGVLQDAIVPVGDMSYQPETGTFVFAANRFRWEQAGAERDAEPDERINTGVTIANVVAVRRKALDFRARGAFLNLLALTCQEEEGGKGPTVELTFSGGTAIRLETTGLLCHLEDFGEPWPTQWRPQHADD